jgi:hypothetical protein
LLLYSFLIADRQPVQQMLTRFQIDDLVSLFEGLSS